MTAGWVVYVLAVGSLSGGFAYVATHATAPTEAGRWRLTVGLLAVIAGLCVLVVIGAPVSG